MNSFLVKQVKSYALGNFIMLTPTIKRLSEKLNKKIDVFFEDKFVKDCFINCDFINIVDYEYKKPDLLSSEINKNLPDYKNIFIKKINDKWDPKYHTYVDLPSEIEIINEEYILFLNGLGGLSINENDKKPNWFGKKEIDLETFKIIKNNTKLPIYFTGSKSDIHNNPWILSNCDKIFIDDIRLSLALIRDAKKIISNDTGLSHCASAMNKEILILWKDTPFVKNINPGKKTFYSKKNKWKKDILEFLNEDLKIIGNGYVYIIPSYNRFDKLIELIEIIFNFNYKNEIIILNDGSDDERYKLLKFYDKRLTYLENGKNLGKEGYWITVNKLFYELSKREFSHFIMLNDDLIPDFNFETKLNIFINNENILRLFTPNNLINLKNWDYPNWIDGIFCSPKKFLELINYQIDPIFLKKSKSKSSGVGKQLTEKLNKFNFKVDFYKSLFEHDGNEDSKMHPEFRKIHPLVSEEFEVKKRLSVIIPTYKNTSYLQECLDSVLLSVKNLDCEILVGIDGCKETLNYIKTKKFDSRIKFYFFEKNVGPYIIKNSLSNISNSEIILFFDSDDIMSENMVADMLELHKTKDIIKPRYYDFIDNVNNHKKITYYGEGVFSIKKEIFMSMNGFEPWRCEADSNFSNRVYKNGLSLGFTKNNCFFRRLHSNSLTQSPETGYHSEIRQKYRILSSKSNGELKLPNLVTENFTEIKVETIINNTITKEIEIVRSKSDLIKNSIKESLKTKKEINYDKVNSTIKSEPVKQEVKKVLEKKPIDREKLIEIKKDSIRKTIEKVIPSRPKKRDNLPNIFSGKKNL